MEVLKTTSLELGFPVRVVQQIKKIICYPNVTTIQETITGQNPEGILQTAAAQCDTLQSKVKGSLNVLMGKAEKETEVSGDLTNVWKKMSQRRTFDK